MAIILYYVHIDEHRSSNTHTHTHTVLWAIVLDSNWKKSIYSHCRENYYDFIMLILLYKYENNRSTTSAVVAVFRYQMRKHAVFF